MEREDFFDVKALSKKIINRSVGISKACQRVVDTHHPDSYIIKSDYNYSDTNKMTKVGLLKARETYTQELFDLSKLVLKSKYKTECLLTQAKCKDLRSFIPILETKSQTCLNNLLQGQELVRILPRAA